MSPVWCGRRSHTRPTCRSSHRRGQVRQQRAPPPAAPADRRNTHQEPATPGRHRIRRRAGLVREAPAHRHVGQGAAASWFANCGHHLWPTPLACWRKLAGSVVIVCGGDLRRPRRGWSRPGVVPAGSLSDRRWFVVVVRIGRADRPTRRNSRQEPPHAATAPTTRRSRAPQHPTGTIGSVVSCVRRPRADMSVRLPPRAGLRTVFGTAPRTGRPLPGACRGRRVPRFCLPPLPGSGPPLGWSTAGAL